MIVLLLAILTQTSLTAYVHKRSVSLALKIQSLAHFLPICVYISGYKWFFSIHCCI